jgi:prepilin-type N-terminal cleavage/methylation domain-containing protein
MNLSFSRRRPSGFTLIELLTVIAIIGVLAGIIIAVIGNVRLSAKKTESLAKLREIGGATLLFANDHRGGLPVWLNFNTNKHWWRYLQDYVGQDPERFHSPAHEGFDPSTNDTFIVTISYGWNYTVMGRHIGDPSKEGDHNLIMLDFANPSKTLIAADARDNSYGFISADSAPAYGRYGSTIPSVFLDGHVSSRPDDEFRKADPWFNAVKALPANKP